MLPNLNTGNLPNSPRNGGLNSEIVFLLDEASEPSTRSPRSQSLSIVEDKKISRYIKPEEAAHDIPAPAWNGALPRLRSLASSLRLGSRVPFNHSIIPQQYIGTLDDDNEDDDDDGTAQPSGLIYHPPPATHITKFDHVSNEISVNHPPLLAQNRTNTLNHNHHKASGYQHHPHPAISLSHYTPSQPNPTQPSSCTLT